MVASEAIPFAKTGGLADVVGALPKALREQGDDVRVLLPLYPNATPYLRDTIKAYENFRFRMGGVDYSADILALSWEGVPIYLLDCPALYARESLYNTRDGDYPDNHIRFAALCRAAFVVARWIFRPNLFHCHDWQASLLGPILKTELRGDPTFIGMKVLLTIHNLGYQGLFPASALNDIGLSRTLLRPDLLEFWGAVNYLKGGIVFADWITTVSQAYVREIQTPEYGFGLDGLLRARSSVLSGIVNGVDYDEWSPEKDRFIRCNYSLQDLSGKRACKADLLREFGLPDSNMHRPLFGIVSRFADQKGFDLIEQIAYDLIQEDLSLVVIGSGEPRYEALFHGIAEACPDRVGVQVTYDNALAHKIEAGSDMFLMPSRYEPCGLNQIYSLRYGSVPVVRATGGLDDTIDKETGFKFQEYAGTALLGAIREALAVYRDPVRWMRMVRKGMAKDFSWQASAAEYSALYRRLVG